MVVANRAADTYAQASFPMDDAAEDMSRRFCSRTAVRDACILRKGLGFLAPQLAPRLVL
jgi:hypothetical protein